jgi:hypothetical protein
MSRKPAAEKRLSKGIGGGITQPNLFLNSELGQPSTFILPPSMHHPIHNRDLRLLLISSHQLFLTLALGNIYNTIYFKILLFLYFISSNIGHPQSP